MQETSKNFLKGYNEVMKIKNKIVKIVSFGIPLTLAISPISGRCASIVKTVFEDELKIAYELLKTDIESKEYHISELNALLTMENILITKEIWNLFGFDELPIINKIVTPYYRLTSPTNHTEGEPIKYNFLLTVKNYDEQRTYTIVITSVDVYSPDV